MSWDLTLVNKETKEPVHIEEKHQITGGTYQLGGTTKLTLNVTCNYSKFFAFMSLEGLTAQESKEVIRRKIWELREHRDFNIHEESSYWDATPKNTVLALINLYSLAEMCPSPNDSVWEVH